MKKLTNKFIKYFASVNSATKSLIIIGMICLVETVITVFFHNYQTNPDDIAIRSVMSSIFGFIFGAQLSENSNIENKNIQTQMALAVSLICLATLIIGQQFRVNQDGAALVEMRNLLFSAVGFLLSRAKQIN